MPEKLYTPNSKFGDYLDDCIALGACQEAVDWSEPYRNQRFSRFMDDMGSDPAFLESWAQWCLVTPESEDSLDNELHQGFLDKIQNPMMRAILYIDDCLRPHQRAGVRAEIKQKLPRVHKELLAVEQQT